MTKEIKILRIVPAKVWYYMYAYTNDGNYFIYSHRDRVTFFGTHEAEDISNFQDIVAKLTTFKYYNEKSENCIGNLSKIEFDKKNNNKIKFGTCLISDHLQINYNADVWVDNYAQEVTLRLFDAGEFANNMTSDIQLPDLSEDKRLKNKEAAFKIFQTGENKKLIELIYEQPKFFQKIISTGYPFTSKQIDKFQELIDWRELSNNAEINWSDEVLSKYSDLLDWENLLANKEIDWPTERIEKFKNKIHWESLSKNGSIKWPEIIPMYIQNVNWKELTRNKSFPWTLDNVRRHAANISAFWGNLSENSGLVVSEKLINEFADRIDWASISNNKGPFWTDEFIYKYQDRLNWNALSRNPALPWSFSFLKLYEDKIDWIELSKNSGMCWSEYILDKYKDDLAFAWLSENPGLPWNLEFVKKYEALWKWSNLGSNSRIPWTEAFIEENLDKFRNYNGTWSLWSNSGLPKNISFWLKHKELLFPTYKGKGLMRVIDASNNDSLPISIDLLFELKDRVDWDVYLFKNVKRTGKYKLLLSQINDKILDLILDTKHFL